MPPPRLLSPFSICPRRPLEVDTIQKYGGGSKGAERGLRCHQECGEDEGGLRGKGWDGVSESRRERALPSSDAPAAAGPSGDMRGASYRCPCCRKDLSRSAFTARVAHMKKCQQGNAAASGSSTKVSGAANTGEHDDAVHKQPLARPFFSALPSSPSWSISSLPPIACPSPLSSSLS